MSQRERLLVIIGAALLVEGAYLIASSRGASRSFLLEAGREFPAVPVTVLEPTAPALNGSIVVLHGLGANRVIMLTQGQRLAAAGFRVYLFDGPGHGNNSSAFSFARVEACAIAILEALSKRGEIVLNRTVLVGHSMGGGIAILVGGRFPLAGTIVVAPAPEPLPRKLPANLLVVIPQFDVPVIQQMERALAERGGARREKPSDFASGNAFREIILPGRSHTGAVFDPTATVEAARWAAAAMGATLPPSYEVGWRSLLGGLMGLAGLGFLFPLAASGFARAWNVRAAQEEGEAAGTVAAIVYWILSALVGISILAFWVPLEFLHLYSGDYLASLALISSVPLLALLRPNWSRCSRAPRGSLGMVVSLGFSTLLAFGVWLNLQIANLWMNAPRWERFPALACVLLPYCLAEEIALGSPAKLKFGRRCARFGEYLLLRFLTWFAAAYAVFTGLANPVLMVFFVGYLAIFSIGQRLAADAVRRRTGSPAAAAVFGAILGAWFVAAAFPLT
jgi:pimeloyl-ACP methyl ester carboxylesterase